MRNHWGRVKCEARTVSVDSSFLVTDLTENAELIGGLKSQVFCLQYPIAGFNSSQQHVIAYPHLQKTNC